MNRDEHTTNRPIPGGSKSQVMEMGNFIMAVEVVRDEDGYWKHPGLPDFDEDAGAYNEWLKAQSLETSFVWLESERDDHPAFISYFENADLNISTWEPTPPDGDGWFLICISDTDDGPAACYARRIELPATIASVPRPEPVFVPSGAKYFAYDQEVEIHDGYDGSAGLAGCGRPVDYVLASEPVAAQPAVPDRRAAACMAAMDHISTETLESFNRVGIKFDATRGYAEELEAEIATLRSAIRAMAAMLQAREWAEHVSTDPDVTDLEVQITELVGTATKLREQNAALVAALTPFAFISKEGVVTKTEGHVAVTTCAEYFNRAEKVLAALASAEGGAAPVAPQQDDKIATLRGQNATLVAALEGLERDGWFRYIVNAVKKETDRADIYDAVTQARAALASAKGGAA